MELALKINAVDCVGCHACEIACKQKNNLPAGPRLIRVYSEGPREIDGKPQLRYRVEHCMQCSSPSPCQEACPTGAISTRDDGVVVIAAELCTGCKNCVASCPSGVMQFDEGKQVALKCDVCVELLEKGLKPACITACPSHCIHVGDRTKSARKPAAKSRRAG
jgi:Fe-S-cluster-containing dehydrogenase component